MNYRKTSNILNFSCDIREKYRLKAKIGKIELSLI